MRGGERALLSLCRLYPEAPVFTLLHVKGSLAPELEAREIRTSFLQRLPAADRRYRHHLDQYARCLETGVWPGYGDGCEIVSLPAFAMKEEEHY